MFRSLTRLFRRTVDAAQLAFELDVPVAPPAATPRAPRAPRVRRGPRIVAPPAPPPRDAAELLDRLRAIGLEGITSCRLTRNRTVMVSFRRGELRVHEGYLSAPPDVLRAVVAFVGARRRAQRRAAEAVILAWQVPRPAAPTRAREVGHPDDEPMAARLRARHEELNARHFGGTLRALPVRVSRRMKSRLGHYSAGTTGEPAEIVISRRHIRRHGWAEAEHTLLHEMVHQWQDESGRPLDHGREFRRKAREVGIAPSARRIVGRTDGGISTRTTDDVGQRD